MVSTTTTNDTDESVAKLSSKLLEGWTMLSETCPRPKCSVPLMRSRDNAEISCVQCDTRFGEDLKPLKPVSHLEKLVGLDKPLKSSETETEVAVDNAGAGPAGAGPGAPASLSSSSQSLAFQTNFQSHGLSPSPRKTARKQKDDSCKGLAEKLLQGWTLTDRYCPVQNCLTPLVRNREGQLLCVNCDKWVIPEDQVASLNKCPEVPPSKEKGNELRSQPQPIFEPPVQQQESKPKVSNEEVCTRAISVLFSKMDSCVARMEVLQQVPGEEASKILDFLNNASKAILAVNDVKDLIHARSIPR